MALQFQPYPILQQTQGQNREQQQEQFNNLNQTLQNMGNSALNWRQQQFQNTLSQAANTRETDANTRAQAEAIRKEKDWHTVNDPLIPALANIPDVQNSLGDTNNSSSNQPAWGGNTGPTQSDMGSSMGAAPGTYPGTPQPNLPSLVDRHIAHLSSQGQQNTSSNPSPLFQGGTQNDPEAVYRKIISDPTQSPVRQQMAAQALQRITEEEKTPYERQGWQLGLDKTKAETGKATAEGAKAQAEANMLNSPGGGFKVQNQLEQQARDLATKIINSRSGDFGIQNQKVSQAIHLRSLLDQYKQVDPRTGETIYNVPNAQYGELAIGLANLVSNGGQAAQETIRNIQQASAQGDLNKMLTYAGFDPTTLGGTTQGIVKNISDSIDRQGMTSEQLREPVLNQIRQQMPTMLDPSVKQRIIDSLGVNSYRQYLESNGNSSANNNGVLPSPMNSNMNQNRNGKQPMQIGRFKVIAH